MTESFTGRAAGCSWTAESREGILTFRLSGEFDLPAATDGKDPIEALMARDERVVVVDLIDVSFMDSSGLRFLVEMRNGVERRGARLLVGRVSPPVRRLLEVAGLLDWFEYLEGEAPEF